MTLTEALQAEALDRTYLDRPDPLPELIGILAGLVGDENIRIRQEASAASRRRMNRNRKDHR